MSPKLKVCLFGSRASGKTTFLAGLEALNVPSQPSRLSVHSASPEVRERLKGLAKSLRAGVWPPSTTRLEQYDLVVKVDAAGGGGTSLIDLHVLDYDGELARQLDAADREELETLRNHVAAADVILLLLDPEQDIVLPGGASAEARQAQAERQAALLGAVEEAWRHRNPDDRRSLPMSDVVVVLTKADTSPELTAPATARAYVEQHLPALLPKVAERLERRPADVGVFPLSAVGAVEVIDGIPVPKPPLAPRGYDELFDYVIGLRTARVRRERRRLAAKILAGVVAAAVVIAGGRWLDLATHESRVMAIANDPTRAPAERIKEGMKSSDPAIQAKAIEIANQEVWKLAHDIAATGSLTDLDDLDDRVKKLRKAAPAQFDKEIDGLSGKLNDRRRQVWFAIIEQKHKNDPQDPSLLKEMNNFLVKFPDGEEAGRVRRWRDEYHTVNWQRAKAAVKDMPVRDAATLKGKAEALQNYLTQHQSHHSPAEVERMQRAVVWGRRLAAPGEYAVRVRESGEFTSGYQHSVRIAHDAGGRGDFNDRHKTTTSDRMPIKRWGDEFTFRLAWTAGERLQVELVSTESSFVVMSKESLAALWQGRGPLQLLDLKGTLSLTATPAWSDYFRGTPRITFDLPDFDDEDIRIVREFLVPGDKW